METIDNSDLRQDLIHDFVQQKKQIQEEIRALAPVTERLRPSLWRKINTSVFLLLLQFGFYLLALASVLIAIFFDRVYPFQYLAQILHKPTTADKEIQDQCYWTVRSLFVLVAVLFWFTAYLVRHHTRQNKVLIKTGKDLKIILGQVMERKAEMEILQQKHFMALPVEEDYEGFVVLPETKNESIKGTDASS